MEQQLSINILKAALLALAFLISPSCCQLVYRKCAFGVEECIWEDCLKKDPYPFDLSSLPTVERTNIELYYDSLQCQFVRDEGTYNCCPKTKFEEGDINLQPGEQSIMVHGSRR